MNRSQGQCLITGVYRSGTEYVAQLLTGHPALSSTLYHVNALRFVATPTVAPATALVAIADRLSERYSLTLDVDAALAHFDGVPQQTRCALYDAAMTTLWLRNGRTHWAEKCQLVWRDGPEFVRDMPNGKVVLVIRDPRSVLASFKHYTYAKPPAYLGAVFNCLDAMQLATSWPSDRLAVIRYEDAARHPAETRQRLLQFLDLDPDAGRMDPSQWRNEKGEAWKANTAFGEKFSVEDAIGRWRILSAAELSFTEAICGEHMMALGYEPLNEAASAKDAELLCEGNDQLTQQLARWRATGEGMQAFPTDPTRRENWQENRTTAD